MTFLKQNLVKTLKWLGQNWFKLFIALFLTAALASALILVFVFMPIESLSSGYSCNVQGIELHGELVTYKLESGADQTPVDQTSSDDIMGIIRNAESDPEIKAILLEVDSYGGSAVGAEEVANSLKQATKPVIAQIRSAGTSAAYWSSTGADMIFASANSDVGGIGITMSYLQNVGQDIKNGLEFIELNTGKFKDTGDPSKPLTFEEKKLLQRDLDIMYGNFITAVARNRNIPVDAVKKLADGSSVLGEMALQNKLIDKIGGPIEVREYLGSVIGEEPSICW
jgi:protease-4